MVMQRNATQKTKYEQQQQWRRFYLFKKESDTNQQHADLHQDSSTFFLIYSTLVR